MLFLPDTGMNVINVKSERSQVGNNGISKCKVERVEWFMGNFTKQ